MPCSKEREGDVQLEANILKSECELHAKFLPRIKLEELAIGTVLYPIVYPGSPVNTYADFKKLVVQTLPETNSEGEITFNVSEKKDAHPRSWFSLRISSLGKFTTEEGASEFLQWISQKKKEINDTLKLSAS